MLARCQPTKIVIFALTLLFLPALLVSEETQKEKAAIPDSCDQEYYPASSEFIPLDSDPQIAEWVKPEFPKIAEQTGVKKADVWVRVLVDKCGNVRKAIVQIPSGHKCGFDEAALNAMQKCKFDPAVLEDEPIAAWVTYKVEFRQELAADNR